MTEYVPRRACPKCAEEDTAGHLVCLHTWFRSDIYGYQARRTA